VGVQFEYSYRNLDPESRRLFALLGSLPGLDVSVYSAAALIDSTVDEAGQLLRRLVNAHLIEPEWGRYTFHDLLRAYAAQCAEGDIDPDGREGALQRYFDWYLTTATAAMDVVDPNRRRLTGSTIGLAPAEMRFDSYDDALAWLDAERSVFADLPSMALQHGWYERAWRLPQEIWRYFYLRGGVTDWTATHEVALTAARRLGAPWAEAETLNNLSTADRRAGRYSLAAERLDTALTLFERVGDQLGVAIALGNLGIVHHRLGYSDRAIDYHQRALDLHQNLDDLRYEAMILVNLGVIYSDTGRHHLALEYYERSAKACRIVGDRRGEAVCIANSGVSYERLGNYTQAVEYLRRALSMHRRNGDRDGEANVLGSLGYTYCQVGRYAEALALHHEARRLAHELGGPDLEAEFENDLGETYRATSDHAEALNRHRRALALGKNTGNRLQLARAHRGIARAQHALGSSATSRAHWKAAIDTYTELSLVDADELRKELAGLDEDCDG
jgi:tetratricopeptide (TPR) repeat protein